MTLDKKPPSLAQLIQRLNLEPHVEGGFFAESYRPQNAFKVDTEHGERSILTCIYYLLTNQQPIGHFHRNRSPIVHFFHLGDPIDYFLLTPNGEMQHKILGPDVNLGHTPQIVVDANVWKASKLHCNEVGYGLIGEAVAPGFDYQDMQLAQRDKLIQAYPQHKELIIGLTR